MPFSSPNSPLPHSSNISLKAVVRNQAWRPLVLRKLFLRFILPANLFTRAKPLYPFPAHRNLLVLRKAATCCQSSQGCRVLNANQAKAFRIQEQSWFIAHGLVTWSQQHAPGIVMYSWHLPHRGLFKANREAKVCMSPWGRTHRFSGKQNQDVFRSSVCNGRNWWAALSKAGAFSSPLAPYSSFSWMSVAPDCSGRVPAPIFLFQATAVLVGRSPNPAHPQIWVHQVPLVPLQLSQTWKILIY